MTIRAEYLFATFHDPLERACISRSARTVITGGCTLNNGKPWLLRLRRGELMRDPFITRAVRMANFHGVWTWEWRVQIDWLRAFRRDLGCIGPSRKKSL